VKTEISKLVANRIDELLSPSLIAAELNVTTREAIQHIFVAIGEGQIKQSDLFFILARKYAEQASLLDQLSPKASEGLRMVFTKLIEAGTFDKTWDADELVLYISYRSRRVYIGDMYVLLTELERTLHQKIKSILIQHYGAAESEWWIRFREEDRQQCALARQNDAQFRAHEYAYTTLTHLKRILDKEKAVFCRHLPQSVVVKHNNISTFLSDLHRLNGIRNQVMHPVREVPPNEAEFVFVREMHSKLCRDALWR
jgi:hypothetical protein